MDSIDSLMSGGSGPGSSRERLAIQRADGTLKDLELEVSTAAPWGISCPDLDGAGRTFEARDLFEALRLLREEIESGGGRVLCAGARRDVFPSRMSRSMGGGRKAYVLHIGRPAAPSELVDIFEHAAPETVGTVEEQKSYYEGWLQSLR